MILVKESESHIVILRFLRRLSSCSLGVGMPKKKCIYVRFIYFPKELLEPCPLALKPKKGLDEAVPVEKVAPPFWAEATATPVEETPPGPADPVPNPAPLPEPTLGKPKSPPRKPCGAASIWLTANTTRQRTMNLIFRMIRRCLRSRRCASGRLYVPM